MTMALLSVADAVAEVLNSGDFSQEFEAQRLFRPQFELSEMDELHVTVVPQSEVTQFLSRIHTQRTCVVDIGVQKKLSGDDNSQVDELVNLVDEISKTFHRLALALDTTTATCMVAKPDPIFSPEHWDQLRQFTSLLTLTFKTTESSNE